MGFPGGVSGKEPTCQCRRHKRLGFNPWVRKIPGGGHGSPLQSTPVCVCVCVCVCIEREGAKKYEKMFLGHTREIQNIWP